MSSLSGTGQVTAEIYRFLEELVNCIKFRLSFLGKDYCLVVFLLIKFLQRRKIPMKTTTFSAAKAEIMADLEVIKGIGSV